MSSSTAPMSLPPALVSSVKYGRMLILGKDARLEWDGAVFRLQLDTGEVIFELRPDQIRRVRDDQRMTLNFKTKSGTHQVYFGGSAGTMMDATTMGAIIPGAGTDAIRQAALTSPANAWLDLLRELGIRVVDNTFVPPPMKKIVLVTLGVTFGAVFLVCLIAFIVIFIQQ
jgi:hypothetical protein